MSEVETKMDKNRERIGVVLLCFILVLSGFILVKDNSNEGEIKENVSQKQNSNYSSSEKGESRSLSQVSSSVKSGQTTNANSKNQATININKASIEELDTLPGIGEKTAQKIIDYRSQNGGFKTTQEIMEVSGIGEAKYSAIRDLISI